MKIVKKLLVQLLKNKASSEIHGGYGIVNNYKYSKEDQDYTVKQSKENKTVQE